MRATTSCGTRRVTDRITLDGKGTTWIGISESTLTLDGARMACSAHVRFAGIKTMPRRYTPEERIQAFWRKTRPDGDCIIWTGSIQGNGYGRVSNGTKVATTAHRFAYEITYGPVPDGMFVLHRCDRPSCVNPEHLFVGSHMDNMADMRAKGRSLRKLSLEDTKRIFEARLFGARPKDLMHIYGITDGSVWKAVQRGGKTHGGAGFSACERHAVEGK